MKPWNKIVIAGGSGFLGQSLADYFKEQCTELVILSRDTRPTVENVTYVQWDGKHQGTWTACLEEADAVINLCGKSVDCRYTKTNRELILSSRLDPTAAIGKAIQSCAKPPKVWINAASATIYRHSETGDLQMTEAGGETGEGFSVEICKAWEKTFYSFETPATRKVNLRIGMVMGKTGGVFPMLRRLVKLGLGGHMGNGRQLMSWMHIDDFCRMVAWSMKDIHVSGTYNCTAPAPLSNRDLMKIMRDEMRIKFGLPAYTWMLQIGAFFIRTEPELVLKSRNVIPERAIQQGFHFEFNSPVSCIQDLLR